MAKMNDKLSITLDKSEPNLENNKSDAIVRIGGVVLGNIPIVGSILTEVFKEIIPNQREERVRIFIEILGDKLKYLEEDVLNSKMKSEEFIDLLEDALPQAARAMNKDRQNYIASLLKNSLNDEQLEHIEKKKLLQLLNELNDAEILLLHFISLESSSTDQTKKIEFAEKHLYLFDDYNERSNDVSLRDKSHMRKCYMSKLEEVGLASKGTPETPISAPWFSRTTSSISKDYNKITLITQGNLIITPLGMLFLRNIDLIEKEES
ncbi:MAG TPA: hypothetical protein VF556_05435 [Pyrinomonadaceae bacterium]